MKRFILSLVSMALVGGAASAEFNAGAVVGPNNKFTGQLKATQQLQQQLREAPQQPQLTPQRLQPRPFIMPQQNQGPFRQIGQLPPITPMPRR